MNLEILAVPYDSGLENCRLGRGQSLEEAVTLLGSQFDLKRPESVLLFILKPAG